MMTHEYTDDDDDLALRTRAMKQRHLKDAVAKLEKLQHCQLCPYKPFLSLHVLYCLKPDGIM